MGFINPLITGGHHPVRSSYIPSLSRERRRETSRYRFFRVEYFFCTVVFVACSMGYPIPSLDSENPDSPFKPAFFNGGESPIFFGYAGHLQA